ncbi:pantoate--beta-alanine ligase, partial [Moraxella catarrhalis]|uniref:pantoate--beta-alanine ligase n=1 Tax=Moraxella catarrhalis TaxID=480 RepID=UPI0018835C84
YLDAAQRALAPRLYAALQAVGEGVAEGRRDFEALCAEQRAALQAAGFRPQYLEGRAPDLGAPRADAAAFVVLAAASLGTPRLIDNLQLRPER